MAVQTIPPTPLFQGLTGEQAESILTCLSAVRKTYEKGETILHAGDRLSALGLVISGTVEVSQDDCWGNRQVMGTIGPGELFGESYACSRGEPLLVTVSAVENAAVMFLDVGKILTVCSPACEYHTRLVHNLLSILADKNLNLTRKIDHMGRRTIREKVLAYLSYEAGRQKKQTFTIPFNRQQLADYLAVDRSALSAELSRMQRDGILKYEKNRFTIKG